MANCKLDNKKYIRLFMFTFLCLILLDLSMIASCIITSFEYSNIPVIVGVFLLLVFSLALSAIRVVEFESSYAQIKIRYCHPFKRYHHGILREFPSVGLQNCAIENSNLTMVIKKSDGDTEAISLRLHGLSTDEVREMERALREIIRNA
ncbi:hypothetical protein [Chryseobacterium sp. ISL-6]|uniref:hypothetical protein n=1 Tax=Chryseobacterium sp. ISL-6 TaxID=2819143 RepID=UPI001BEA239E|nr:hypothetical protein [Chryseobacterium sp. ISL-6]MBT2620084.1 hypothetical protein [Chryseobacterium sp. ISL-6]